MTTTNRYAPPKAVLEDRLDADGSLWRDGKILVLRKGSDFPDRCIKCNQPSVMPRRRYKLSWHPWGWYVLLPLNILFYAIVAAIVSNRTEVRIGLCANHQRRVLWGRIVGWGGFAAMLALGLTAAALESPTPGIVALALLLPWAIAAIVVNRQVLPARIDGQFTRLKGCGPAFLASLPDRTPR